MRLGEKEELRKRAIPDGVRAISEHWLSHFTDKPQTRKEDTPPFCEEGEREATLDYAPAANRLPSSPRSHLPACRRSNKTNAGIGALTGGSAATFKEMGMAHPMMPQAPGGPGFR